MLKEPVAIRCTRCCPTVFFGKKVRFQAEIDAACLQKGLQGAFRNENRIGLRQFKADSFRQLLAWMHDRKSVNRTRPTASLIKIPTSLPTPYFGAGQTQSPLV